MIFIKSILVLLLLSHFAFNDELIENWSSITRTDHFNYFREGLREYSDTATVNLIEKAYSYYYDLFKIKIPSVMIIKDKIGIKQAAVNKYSKDSSIITITLPGGFGKTEQDKALAYHFYVHELLHCWLYGPAVSHEIAMEVLVKFQTNLFLWKNNYISESLFYKETITGIHDSREMLTYQHKYYELYKYNNKTYWNLLKDMALFINVNKADKIDLFPILKKYIGPEIIAYYAENDLPDKKLYSLPKDRPSIGVSLSGNDLKIIDIISKSPAEIAGLKVGDIILKIDNIKIDGTIHLINTIIEKGYGRKIMITIRRQENEFQVPLTIGLKEENKLPEGNENGILIKK